MNDKINLERIQGAGGYSVEGQLRGTPNGIMDILASVILDLADTCDTPAPIILMDLTNKVARIAANKRNVIKKDGVKINTEMLGKALEKLKEFKEENGGEDHE